MNNICSAKDIEEPSGVPAEMGRFGEVNAMLTFTSFTHSSEIPKEMKRTPLQLDIITTPNQDSNQDFLNSFWQWYFILFTCFPHTGFSASVCRHAQLGSGCQLPGCLVVCLWLNFYSQLSYFSANQLRVWTEADLSSADSNTVNVPLCNLELDLRPQSSHWAPASGGVLWTLIH